MSNACAPQSSPVRPKPVMTSSSMSSTSYFVEHGLDLREVAVRRQQHAADAHQWLRDERRDRVRPFAHDQLLEARREPRRVVVLALAGARAAIVVRRVRVQERRQRHVEQLVKRRQAREPADAERRAVVTLRARDDLLLLRPPERVVVVPDELDLRVVGVRARVAEEHARRCERRHPDELFGEQNAGLVALAREEMRERQLLDLIVRRARELVVAVAERRAPEPGHRFDVLLAVVVPDVDALAAHEHERLAAVQRREIRVRVEHALRDRALRDRCDAAGGHRCLLLSEGGR